MTRARIIAGLCAVMIAPPSAFGLENCELTRDENSCVRAVACLGKDRLFHGRAIGWNDMGTLAGSTNEDATCTGEWDGRYRPGVANLTCDNGMTGQIVYFQQDGATGTVIGFGETNDGAKIKAWSGENVLQFFSDQGFEPGMVPCDNGAIPMS